MNIFATQFLKKEGLIILIITLLGYGVALSYEIGYAIYFSFDTEYIQVDIKSIYTGILGVSSFFLIALVFITVLKQKQTSDRRKLTQIIVYVVLIGLLSTPTAPKIIFANVITAITLCTGVSVLYISYYYLSKREILTVPVLIGIACLFIIAMSTTVGISRASTETSFSVFKYENGEYAIIRIYNGSIVGIKVEKNKLSHTDKIYMPSSEVKTLQTRTIQVPSKPGLLNYKIDYPEFRKRTLGDLILKESDEK
ncbi:hypothetical protein ACRS9C_06990 [Serratia marcescens]|uniref:hypothetical protein n=1 Tax=Serratia marcescens TaxID=615 RepID=UPI003EE05A25